MTARTEQEFPRKIKSSENDHNLRSLVKIKIKKKKREKRARVFQFEKSYAENVSNRRAHRCGVCVRVAGATNNNVYILNMKRYYHRYSIIFVLYKMRKRRWF